MSLATLKTARATAKRSLTMKLNSAKVSLAEDRLEDINRDELIQLLRTFTKKHEAYAEAALEAEDETEESLDTYLQTQQEEYAKIMCEIRDALRQATNPDVKYERMSSSGSSLDITREELLGVLSLNSVDYLKPYDGNPLTFHVFITSFDQTVDKIADPHHKLSHLLRFTSGDAFHAIEGCAIIGGSQGYQRARDILETRFGDKNKVSRSIIKHLTRNIPVKNSDDLQT